jgi:hypothetical protein
MSSNRAIESGVDHPDLSGALVALAAVPSATAKVASQARSQSEGKGA